jgi:DNA invertase Pin-like site-specific DNA recombinase
VSSKEQGKSGFGLQSQEAEVNAFADAAGYRLVRVYREVASAIGTTKVKRPELLSAIKEASQKGYPLIVSRLDRLSRDATELEEIVTASGIEVTSVADWPNFSAVSLRAQKAKIERETELLKERTRQGLEKAKQQGTSLGNRKNLDEAQRKGTWANQRNSRLRAQELDTIVEGLKRAGAQTGPEIAERLNGSGFRTAQGKLWTDANVRRVLRRLSADAHAKAEEDQFHKSDPNWGLF